LLFLVTSARAAETEPPPLPAAYYGTVVDPMGLPVSSGMVEAYLWGRKAGEAAVDRGNYGGPGGLDPKLVVSGTAADQGRPVVFQVITDGRRWRASCEPPVTWIAGDVRRVDLRLAGVAPRKGDVNNDGQINVLDVVRAVNIALGRIRPTDEDRYAADVNDDGNVNVLDVVRIVNIALGRL
jgi:hypothetical protein